MLDESVEKRRSIYSLGKKQILSPQKITELVGHAIKYCPTAFNSQSPRVVILFGKNHDRLWDIVLNTLKAMIPGAAFAKTRQKIEGSFKSGFGTVLFFEDEDTTKNLQNNFPTYKDNFPRWAEQANGMLQYTIWTSLAEQGIGASLQHYNPLIDSQVRKEWNLPVNWRFIAQMPFGSIESPAGDKDFLPIDQRIRVFE